jgi:hypothetical protein
MRFADIGDGGRLPSSTGNIPHKNNEAASLLIFLSRREERFVISKADV